MTEDVSDKSNVNFFLRNWEEKNGGCLYFVMSSVSWRSKAFGFRNLCYSKISVVMLKSERKKYALRPNAAYLNSLCRTNLKQ